MKITNSFITAVTAHIRHFLKKSYRDNISALAGQSAFFILLSVVPFLMFAFSLITILTGKDPESFQFPEFDWQTAPYIGTLFRFVDESVRRSGSGTTIITAVVTLWSAGKGMYCITEGISRVYKLPNRKLWLFKRIYAMGYTVVMLLMLLLCVGVMAMNIFFAGTIASWWGGKGVRWLILGVLYLLFGVLQALLMTLALKLYLRGKLKNSRWRTVRALFPGMLLTVIAWNVLTFGVMIYIRRFATSSIYGSLGSVFMVMVWVYFMMYILLYGIQLDYIYRSYFSGLRMTARRKKKKEKQVKTQ